MASESPTVYPARTSPEPPALSMPLSPVRQGFSLSRSGTLSLARRTPAGLMASLLIFAEWDSGRRLSVAAELDVAVIAVDCQRCSARRLPRVPGG